ncbi:class I adenylate-forming enzyme family protein [Sutcliffiella deserti]|uniref:class I adenylate-forming enzyme family protein n=1 Tax=Sutcliffiella deserti TaxID=2875501 RepID=UPI001CBDB26F|nr:long-chain fatty acid--CoA ligase [Sutcliffiella deserti]
MNIGMYVAQNARKHPEKLAIKCEDRTYNYDQFNREVNRLSHGMMALGVEKGDKVAFMMKNSDYFVFSFFAGVKIGAVIVPMNFRLTSSEIHYILEQSEAKVVICDEEFEDTVKTASEGCVVQKVIVVGNPGHEESRSYKGILSRNEEEPDVEVLETDDIEILYTSGTTGRPKGALFDHRRIFNVGISMMISMGINQQERFLHVAPLFHSAQLNLFLVSGVVLGASHYIQRDFHPVHTLQAIQDNKITHFFGVPAMFNFLLQVPNANEYDLSSIKRCGYGAAPMAPELVKKSITLFKNDQFYNLCGLTEAGPNGILLDPKGHKNHLGKNGKASFLTEARVVDEAGGNVKPGAVGEFVLQGESIMKEYYKKPEETKATLKNGWLYTGDLAVIDEEGYITLVDRKKDMIISGGENVYSIEVEEVLYEHPQVLEAAIIGLPDEVWGEAVCAVVVPHKDQLLNEEELKLFCRQKLAGYKVPRRIFIENALPRNASGKILKYQLRKQLNEVKA